MKPSLVKTAELLFLGVIPVVALVLALAAYAGDDRLALDFHHELYRQADAVVNGREAYEAPGADLSDRANLLWPMAAVLPVVPLTVVPAGVADWIATALVLAALVAALWVLDVRDWRVYGVVLLWPATIEAVQTANASLPLTLLVALMWRYRDHALPAGVALGYGIAVKLFLWPIAVWLALVGRVRAALVAAVAAGASLLLLVPFIGIGEYAHLLRRLGDTFEHETYTLFALLTDIGVPDTAARVATSRRRRSAVLALAVAPPQPRPRDRGRTRALADRVASLLRSPARPARALASTVRRRVADSHRPLGRRRHVQRRAMADRLRPRARRAHVRALRASSAGRARRDSLPDPAHA